MVLAAEAVGHDFVKAYHVGPALTTASMLLAMPSIEPATVHR
jgi:hypothetical protein